MTHSDTFNSLMQSACLSLSGPILRRRDRIETCSALTTCKTLDEQSPGDSSRSDSLQFRQSPPNLPHLEAVRFWHDLNQIRPPVTFLLTIRQ